MDKNKETLTRGKEHQPLIFFIILQVEWNNHNKLNITVKY